MKIVINKCHGGFGLSQEAMVRLAELKKLELHVVNMDYMTHYYNTTAEKFAEMTEDQRNEVYWFPMVDRNDPDLIQVVEELGEKANGEFSDLRIVTIPKGVKWEIAEYDGNEWIAEVHRTWS